MIEFIKISWRNLGRNTRRTLVIIFAIALGVWGGLMMIALDNVFAYQMVDSFIYANLGHIQIHQKGYSKSPDLKLCMIDGKKILDRVKEVSGIAGYSPRIINFALAQSARASHGIILVGIEPELEPTVSRVKQNIIRGRYFTSDDESGVLVGRSLSQKLKVDVGDKIAFFTQGFQSEESIVESLRIIGIFQSGISEIDKSIVYIPLRQAERIFGMNGMLNEISVTVDDERKLEIVKRELKKGLEGKRVNLSFEEMSGSRFPVLRFTNLNSDELILYPEAYGESFKRNSEVVAVSFRLSLPIAAIHRGRGGKENYIDLILYGVEPVNENRVSSIFDRIEIAPDSWLYGTEKDKELSANQDWVILSENAALALNVKPGDTIHFDSGDRILALEVAGTLKNGFESGINKQFAIMSRRQMWENFISQSSAREIVVRLKEGTEPVKAGEDLIAGLDLEVLDWKELYPVLAQAIDLIEYSNYILLLCFYIVVGLGIANTMIMSVFERVRELGILKAIGTSPAKLFGMVILESVMLSIFGMVLGGFMSGISYWIWMRYGLDLSMFAEGLSAYGIPSVLYPVLTLKNILTAMILAVVIAIVSALYPAFRASRLLVVDAIRRF